MNRTVYEIGGDASYQAGVRIMEEHNKRAIEAQKQRVKIDDQLINMTGGVAVREKPRYLAQD